MSFLLPTSEIRHMHPDRYVLLKKINEVFSLSIITGSNSCIVLQPNQTGGYSGQMELYAE